ncbi:MAG TPA: tetratricopeptide repeat protein [Candidatus Cloacimonadota bacterium]|nr:tetratricopeptide repeat protein [Candidatus Cloacimonadota bacterium]HQL15274.1 tetratricopeptide repeat protein [Candidatus Cloacimonadota bacterium]
MNLYQKLMLPILRTRGQRQLLTGSRKKALAIFEKLCRWSDKPENRFNLALVKMNLRDYQGALEILANIYKLLPDQVFAGLTYGQCLLLAKEWDEAEKVYSELLALHPENNLLKMMSELAKDPVAGDKFTASLDLQFQANLLEEGKKYREALELLTKAVGLTPEDAALHNNLGALKLKLKYPMQDVLSEFSKAMQLNPEKDVYKRNYRKAWQKSHH